MERRHKPLSKFVFLKHLMVTCISNLSDYFGRLRITVTAAHTEADVDALLSALPRWIKEKGKSQTFFNDAPLWLPSNLFTKSALEDNSQLAHNVEEDQAGLPSLDIRDQLGIDHLDLRVHTVVRSKI
jgi:hypothetical protein